MPPTKFCQSTRAQPHWDAAKTGEAKANECVQVAKQLREQVTQLERELANLNNNDSQVKALTAKLKDLKAKQKAQETEEKHQRAKARTEKATGDGLYYPIYNLDQKNPNIQDSFEHIPPEELLASILEKDRRVAELMAEIKDLLHEKPL